MSGRGIGFIAIGFAVAVVLYGFLFGWPLIEEANERVDGVGLLTESARAEAQAEIDEGIAERAAARDQPTPIPSPDGPVEFGDRFPEVIAVEATLEKNDQWRFDVTLSSPYDTPERYADAWRVLDERGRELGIRELLHDHASEQPFTRSATVQVPFRTDVVFVEGRDQGNGWSGQRFEFTMP